MGRMKQEGSKETGGKERNMRERRKQGKNLENECEKGNRGRVRKQEANKETGGEK